MNISKRDTKLLLILFGLVIFVLCYFLVYLEYTEENENLLIDIEDADFELFRLKMIEQQIAGYNQAVARSTDTILAAQSRYPADVRAEDLTPLSNSRIAELVDLALEEL